MSEKQILEILEIKQILHRFLKLNHIFVTFYSTINHLDKNIDDMIKVYLVHKNADGWRLEEFFQKIDIFCTWMDTIDGHNFWSKYSLFWRIYLLKHPKYPSNNVVVERFKSECLSHGIVTQEDLLIE